MFTTMQANPLRILLVKTDIQRSPRKTKKAARHVIQNSFPILMRDPNQQTQQSVRPRMLLVVRKESPSRNVV